MLSLTASGIADLTDNLERLADCLNALFHPDYSGTTKSETLGMLQSAKEKNLGRACFKYEPSDVGPLPFGYLDDGRYVFYDQRRSILLTEGSNRLITLGTLLNMAPEAYWIEQFPKFNKNKLIGADATRAGDTLMEACCDKGGFDPSLVRGRGVYLDANRKVVVNWGQEIPQDSKYIYVCHLPLNMDDVRKDDVDALEILKFFELFNWNSPSAAYLLFGWVVTAVICGVLEWRPHLFLSGAKNTGKTTIVNALIAILEPIAIVLDGQSTEAGIRQKVGADSRPVILDEFESDQDVARMKRVIKLIRSASSANYAMARGTPEGKVLEFTLRSSFMLAAINPMATTTADQSRTVVLPLSKHNNDKKIALRISKAIEKFEGIGPSWCACVIDNIPHILGNIKVLRRVFPPSESRHALNMSILLAAAWTLLNQSEMTEDEADKIISKHKSLIDELAEVHEEDDSFDCLSALLEFSIEHSLLGAILSELRQLISQNGDREHIQSSKHLIQKYGLRWEDGGFLVANSHRGVAEIYRGTLWETGGWVSSLPRLEGAKKHNLRRFSGDKRSRCTWIPADLIPDDYLDPENNRKW